VVGFRQGDIPHPAIALLPNSTLVIPNRQIGYNRTVDGNLAQCQPATSEQEWMPGQFPLAAIDGAISTKWQPKLSNETAWVTVQLNDEDVGRPVTAFTFDFAQFPPQTIEIDFSNATFGGSGNGHVVRAFNTSKVQITNPWDQINSAQVMRYVGNATTFNLDVPVYTGKYARLGISGNQGTIPESVIPKNESLDWLQGATIAEWNIISDSAGRQIPLSPVSIPLNEGSR